MTKDPIVTLQVSFPAAVGVGFCECESGGGKAAVKNHALVSLGLGLFGLFLKESIQDAFAFKTSEGPSWSCQRSLQKAKAEVYLDPEAQKEY